MKDKIARLFRLRPLHISVIALLYLHGPAHAAHLQKILPLPLLKKIQRKYDGETSKRFQKWTDLMKIGSDLREEDKLVSVNRFFNHMKWVEDEELWGQKDYWATPVESLLKNAGDCEDFSIAKYFTLLEMGVPEEKLKISYVKYQHNRLAHMVLTYYPEANSEPLILDNTTSDILKSSERTDLVPVFHLNNLGVWDNEQPPQRLGSADKIQQWKEMIERLQGRIPVKLT